MTMFYGYVDDNSGGWDDDVIDPKSLTVEHCRKKKGLRKQTILHSRQPKETILKAIELGADLHAYDFYDNTPLDSAIYDIEKTIVLLQAGADPNRKHFYQTYNTIERAVGSGREEVAKVLFDYGAWIVHWDRLSTSMKMFTYHYVGIKAKTKVVLLLAATRPLWRAVLRTVAKHLYSFRTTEKK